MPAVPLEALRELLRHMEWADSAVWRAVAACPAAAADARLRDVMHHLHGVQRRFLAVWTAGPLDAPARGGAPDLTSAQASARAYYEDLRSALPTFDEAALRRPVRMPGLEPYEAQLGRTFDTPTLGETMLQVTSHSTYHRGQANARLREIGGVPPNVDYIAWIWLGRPSPEWPAA